MEVTVDGQSYRIDLYRDDAGNFVADAIGPRDGSERVVRPGDAVPVARALGRTSAEALASLKQSLWNRITEGDRRSSRFAAHRWNRGAR